MLLSKILSTSLHKSKVCILQNCRFIYTSEKKFLFFESSPKGEYAKDDERSFFDKFKEGWKELGNESKLFQQEVIEKFTGDAFFTQPGEVLKQWELKCDSDLQKWITTSDSDNNEGSSSCQFVISKYNHALFTGILNNQVPKDGKTKRTGYCSVRTTRFRRSFKREISLDWSPYTHLVIRLKGDGRTYLLNIGSAGYFDSLWNDVYHYMLFTRGGPYWQVAKIPFSKFILSSKGRIQDKQDPIEFNNVTSFGITAADQINGRFQLEIDYIGVEYDPTHQEETAYEMYKTPRFLLGS